jgi:hypothetical protein
MSPTSSSKRFEKTSERAALSPILDRHYPTDSVAQSRSAPHGVVLDCYLPGLGRQKGCPHGAVRGQINETGIKAYEGSSPSRFSRGSKQGRSRQATRQHRFRLSWKLLPSKDLGEVSSKVSPSR